MFEKLFKVDKVLAEIRKNRKEIKKIPVEVLDELKDVRDVTSKPIPRQILQLIEQHDGRVNVTELRNKCETSDVCSRNTFYKYIKKLEQKGVVEREKDGRKTFVRSSSKTIINISQ